MNPAEPDSTSSQRATIGPPVRLGKTLRASVRTAWDHLGLVCLVSLTLVGVALVPVSIALKSGPGIVRLLFSLTFTLFTLPPLFAGACWLANVCIEHDEPSYVDLWRGARRLYARAVGLGAAQGGMKLILISNLIFYFTRNALPFFLLGILFVYLLAFWLMQMLYHVPLLVAAERGLLQREEDGQTPVSAILRNALVLCLASPAYSFGIVALLALLAIPSVASGAGLALILPGFSAFVVMQATRDQLVRFGHMPPPANEDEPVADERWQVR